MCIFPSQVPNSRAWMPSYGLQPSAHSPSRLVSNTGSFLLCLEVLGPATHCPSLGAAYGSILLLNLASLGKILYFFLSPVVVLFGCLVY